MPPGLLASLLKPFEVRQASEVGGFVVSVVVVVVVLVPVLGVVVEAPVPTGTFASYIARVSLVAAVLGCVGAIGVSA